MNKWGFRPLCGTYSSKRDGEIHHMTLPSKIRDLRPGYLRPNTLPLCQDIKSGRERNKRANSGVTGGYAVSYNKVLSNKKFKFKRGNQKSISQKKSAFRDLVVLSL